MLIAPGVYYVFMPSLPPADEVETTIKSAGFDPLVPPNRLRGPGALYVVEGGGRYTKVCDAEPNLLKEKIHRSPTPAEVHDRLESAGFSVAGRLLASIKGSLGAARVTSIEYTLAEPAISEISLSDLSEIEDGLLQQKRCDETVQRLLKHGKKVCSGAAALSATTRYKVHVDAKFETDAEDHALILSAAQKALTEHTQSEIRSTGTDELVGEDLFYGIQLSELCITLDTATEPSVLTNADVPRPPVPHGGI
jgi:hypothetical protein